MLNRYLTIACCALLSLGAAADELTPAKRADIRKLIEVTGGVGVAQQFATAMSQSMFRNLKTARPEVPDRALEIMNRELTALFAENMNAPGGLIDRMIPLYDKHFTHAELKELIAFYQTGVGRKATLVLPKIVSEGMLVGQRWGESLTPEIEKRVIAALRKEGLLPQGKK